MTTIDRETSTTRRFLGTGTVLFSDSHSYMRALAAGAIDIKCDCFHKLVSRARCSFAECGDENDALLARYRSILTRERNVRVLSGTGRSILSKFPLSPIVLRTVLEEKTWPEAARRPSASHSSTATIASSLNVLCFNFFLFLLFSFLLSNRLFLLVCEPLIVN